MKNPDENNRDEFGPNEPFFDQDKDIERTMKELGLDVNKYTFNTHNGRIYTMDMVKPFTVNLGINKPKRDDVICQDDVQNFLIELGLYETGKKTFEEMLQNI